MTSVNALDSGVEQVIRYEKAGPILGLIGAGILLGVAGFFLRLTNGQPIDNWPFIAYWFVFAPGLAGLWFLITRLIRLIDRSPKVVLRSDGIVLCDYSPHVLIGWDRIRRARFSRSTENGAETRAHITLIYLDDSGSWQEAWARVDRLTMSSHAILRTIEQRANLSGG